MQRVNWTSKYWVLCVGLALFLPTGAFAWAPATHLFFAKEVLAFPSLLPPAIYSLIQRHLQDFFYGCVAADITIGKAYVEYLYNCHNFDVGMGLLKHAKGDAEKAFVYGYLSHLAADTVSHNFFVPYQNVEHYEMATFRHAYWEVRLDQMFLDRVRGDFVSVVENPRTRQHDKLLDGALKDTIFSFKTNRVLFGGMMAIQRVKKWQAFVKTVNLRAKRQFNPTHLSEYNRLAVSAIIHLFQDGKKSPVYLADPTGHKIISESKEVRNYLRRLKRRGELTEKIHKEECERFRSHVRRMYFEAYAIDNKQFHPSIHMKV